jgi:hypothetical protein
MSIEREEVYPLPRVGPVPMIHWENGRACAGPPPNRPHSEPASASASGDAAPSAHAPSARGADDT